MLAVCSKVVNECNVDLFAIAAKGEKPIVLSSHRYKDVNSICCKMKYNQMKRMNIILAPA